MRNKIIIFTGAGLSAGSGISTFRDSGGLWDNYNIDEICSAGCLDWNYEKTIEFYNKRRLDLIDKKPNNAHKMCKRLQEKYPDKIALITQNVDNLLEAAGCYEVVHLHGFLEQIRCMKCESIADIGLKKQDKSNSTCKCGGKMRPNIVFFGEAAPLYSYLYSILQSCSLLVVIGTSGQVIDVNFLNSHAPYSILNNLETSLAIQESSFDKVYLEDANTAYEKIEKDVEFFMENEKL